MRVVEPLALCCLIILPCFGAKKSKEAFIYVPLNQGRTRGVSSEVAITVGLLSLYIVGADLELDVLAALRKFEFLALLL